MKTPLLPGSSALWGCVAALVVTLPLLAACSAERPADSGSGLASTSDTLLPIGGTRLFVHRAGHGEPAIVIHGGPVLDHGYLVPWLAPLEDRLELVYYDQRLSGRSEGRVDSASVRLATFVQDIEGLRAALGLERVHLIAHSWGGLLAMEYALAHPDRVRSMVLLDPLPPSSALWRREQAAEAAALTPEDTAGAGALRASPAFAAREPAAVEAVLRHSFRASLHDPALADRLHFRIEPDYAERSRQFGFMLPDLVAFDVVDSLRAVLIPTLVVYGGDEPGAGIGGRALAGALADGRVVVIPGAGHFPFMERPAAFRAAVMPFLDSVAR